MKIPEGWYRSDLGDYGTLFRAGYQLGMPYEDCYIYVTAEDEDVNNDQLFSFAMKKNGHITNATMKMPASEGDWINYNGQIIFEEINAVTVLGTTGEKAKCYSNITHADTAHIIDGLPEKTESMFITRFETDGIQYLVVVGYPTSDKEGYIEKISRLSDIVVNSVRNE
jgi:hypothetical protein